MDLQENIDIVDSDLIENDDIIKENDFVLLKLPSDNYKIVQIKLNVSEFK